VDARGTGIRTKVTPALKERNAQYRIQTTDDYLKVVVGKTAEKTFVKTSKVSVKSVCDVGKESVSPLIRVGKASGKILTAIRDRNDITIPELANLVGVTPRTVERHLKKLQQNGMLKRIGGRKHGHWEVTG